MRVLLGGVGYRFLRDGSLGPVLADRLVGGAGDGAEVDVEAEVEVEVEVEVEDLSYGPVALSHNLRERPPYDRMVLVAAVARGDAPGAIRSYRWDHRLPPATEVQERVAEAVTGVISLDNLLVVCGALGGLPEDVRVVEVEPADEGWGEGFSAVLDARMPDVLEAVWTSTLP